MTRRRPMTNRDFLELERQLQAAGLDRDALDVYDVLALWDQGQDVPAIVRHAVRANDPAPVTPADARA